MHLFQSLMLCLHMKVYDSMVVWALSWSLIGWWVWLQWYMNPIYYLLLLKTILFAVTLSKCHYYKALIAMFSSSHYEWSMSLFFQYHVIHMPKVVKYLCLGVQMCSGCILDFFLANHTRWITFNVYTSMAFNRYFGFRYKWVIIKTPLIPLWTWWSNDFKFPFPWECLAKCVCWEMIAWLNEYDCLWKTLNFLYWCHAYCMLKIKGISCFGL